MTKIQIYKQFIYFFLLIVLSVFLSYFYIDREIALFVEHQKLSQYFVLKYFTYLSDCIVFLVVPLYFILLLTQSDLKPAFFKKIKFYCNTITFGFMLKFILKPIFGRYWPKTWVCNNPSFIDTGSYSFNFFKFGKEFESFPSGHSVIITSAMLVLMYFYPKWKYIFLGIIIIVTVSLVLMNYHFLSDVIAGVFIGWIVFKFQSRIELET